MSTCMFMNFGRYWYHHLHIQIQLLVRYKGKATCVFN